VSGSQRCAYVVASAAPPVLRISEFIAELQKRQWKVCLIATPTAATWIDLDEISSATGCVARATPRGPREREALPPADALVVAPLTFNTLNKWAAGISDTLALGILNELLGVDIPTIAAPCIKSALQQHPAYSDSTRRLTECGVTVMNPELITTRDDDGLATFEWARILQEINTDRRCGVNTDRPVEDERSLRVSTRRAGSDPQRRREQDV
jgi:phosphopantothenoylcysteine synthetase/decarboxylase